MAGDWIPMRLDLADDPAVIGMAAVLGIDEDAVVGKLHRLWSWANRELENGHAPSVTEKWIDRLVSVTGFATAMSNAGWLQLKSGGGIVIPDFDEWNSGGSKKRLLAAKRQRKLRSQDEKPVTSMSRSQRDKSVTRALPEERIEDKKKPPYPPSGGMNGSAAHPPPNPRQPPSSREALRRAIAEVAGVDPATAGRSLDTTTDTLLAADPPYSPADVWEFGRQWPELFPERFKAGEKRPWLNRIKNNIGRLRSGEAAPDKNKLKKETAAILADLPPPMSATDRAKLRGAK